MTRSLASPTVGTAPSVQTDENNQPGGDSHFAQQQQQQQQQSSDGFAGFEPKQEPCIQQTQEHFLGHQGFGCPAERHVPMCANTECGQPIADPYILRVQPDLEFHPGCLKCVECGNLLDERAGSVFVRDGKLLCREDYFRLYVRRCQRCAMPFQPTDFVMRARQLVFHMNCFTCITCSRPLMPGQQFLLRQEELFCRPECFMHFQQLPPPPPFQNASAQFLTLQQPIPVGFQPHAEKGPLAMAGSPPFELTPLANNGGNGAAKQASAGQPQQQQQCSPAFARPQPVLPQQHQQQQSCPSAVSSGASPLSFSNPEDSLTPSSTNASTPTGSAALVGHFPGGGAFHGTGASFDQSMANGGNQQSQGMGSNCSSSSGSLAGPKPVMKKSKKEKPAQRVRTVLNESQLKILKQTYNQNQRPDTVTKEQLVEMTGLNARVIRVWFQNKRCKDKKRQLEQREKLQNQEKEQALRGVRISGIGPLTVSSPGPMLDQSQQQFPNAVEIRQIPQNAGLWANEGLQLGGLEGCGPLDSSPFQHPNAMAMMSSGGLHPEFLHHPNPAAMLPSIPMFPQHAITE